MLTGPNVFVGDSYKLWKIHTHTHTAELQGFESEKKTGRF